jgi:RNA polymerase sigma-70 factor (ECF subfamily)
MAGPERDDEDLVRRLEQGDESAFEALVARHGDAVYRFARWHLAEARGEAEDVAQDVFVEVFRSLGRFEGRSRLRTWILGVAMNVCRARRRAAALAARHGASDDETLRRLPDTGVDLERALEAEDLRERVRSAIDGLGTEHRTVVLLRDIEGLSYAEIAALLHVPLGTVRSRLHNARVELGSRLRVFVRPGVLGRPGAR